MVANGRFGACALRSARQWGMDNLYLRARPWITAAVASGAVAGVTFLGYEDKLQAAWSAALTGAIAVFALNLDRFKNFAFGWTGLKAEMNSVIEHATATMDQLRALATSTARSSLTQSMASMLGPRTMQTSEQLRLDLKVIDVDGVNQDGR